MLMKNDYTLKGKPRWLFRTVATLAVLFLTATGSMAQGSARVNIDRKNATLPEVFEQVRRQTSLSVIYSNDDVKDVARRDYLISNATVEQAMGQVLRGTNLEYELSDNVIVIRRGASPTGVVQTPTMLVIRGHVRDEGGQPVIGASVVLRGTQIGTATDTSGYFELRVPGSVPKDVNVSYLGMESQDVRFTGTPLQIVLKSSATEMEKVVVTGIFDRRAESYTGANSTFQKVDIERTGNMNIVQALKNLDPSFQVLESNDFGSDPNRLPEIQMRGASNFSDMKDKYQTNPNQPLFIVDGFEQSLQKVMDMDMNRVESVTILKDATAKALYGSKGANGVVVIETATPEVGRMKVTYTGDFNLTTPDLSSYNLTNAAEKLEVERLAGVYTSVNNNPLVQDNYDQKYHLIRNEVLRGVETDWMRRPLRVGFGQKHALFFEGGNEAFRYGIDFSYNKVAGVMKGSDRETFAGAMTLQYRYKNFIFRDQLSITYNDSADSPYGRFSDFVKMNPYWRMYNEDGTLREILDEYKGANTGSSNIYNPLINGEINTKYASNYLDVTNNLYAEWNAFDGMRFKGRFGLVLNRNENEIFLPRDHTTFRNIGIDEEEYFNRGRYTKQNGKGLDYNVDISANYLKEFAGKHVLSANAQWSMSQKKSDYVAFVAEGFANNNMDFPTHAKQYPEGSSPSGGESFQREASLLASVNYSFDERYLFDATYRLNGSSLFGNDKRWGNFWSVGIGWNIHREAFLGDAKWLDKLRLRLTTGLSGSQNFNTYQALASYKYYNESYDNIVGAYQMGLANPNLVAQKTHDYNLGLDFSILKRLDLTLDLYVKDTEDMLTPVDLPYSTGFTSYVENLGEIRNKGVELGLNWRIVSNNERQLYFSVFAKGTHNKNEITKISDALTSLNKERDDDRGNTKVPNDETNHLTNKGVTKPAIRYAEGQSLDAIWVVRSLGIDPMTGREVFLNRFGEMVYKWDPQDQVAIGVALPKFSGTFGFNFEYKGFTANATFYFRLGGQMYNQTLVDRVENADIQYNVDRRLFSDRWSAENKGTASKYKNFSTAEDFSFTRPTSRFVMNLSELQLSSLNVGYDFRNLPFMQNGGIERLRVQLYTTDLFRASTVKTERGIEYPFARTFSLKISATF